MSVDSDNESDVSVSNSNILFECEPDEIPSIVGKSFMEEEREQEQEFIYDDELKKLICIGISFDDIPLNILHDYSMKTKVNNDPKEELVIKFLFV